MITLESLDKKLDLLVMKNDILATELKAHISEDRASFLQIRKSLDGRDEYPGIRGRLDRLEQRAFAKRRGLAYLWAAVAALGAGMLERFWH